MNPTSDDATLQQRVRERAYQLWEQAGRPDNRQDEFWQQAEREVREMDQLRDQAEAPPPTILPG